MHCHSDLWGQRVAHVHRCLGKLPHKLNANRLVPLTFTLCSESHSCQYLPLTSSLSFWQLSCKILHFFHQYMMACNYFWMLCEGIYLHTLIVVAVFTEEQHLRWYYLLGWGMYFFQLSFESPSPLSVNLQSSSSLGLKKWSGVSVLGGMMRHRLGQEFSLQESLVEALSQVHMDCDQCGSKDREGGVWLCVSPGSRPQVQMDKCALTERRSDQTLPSVLFITCL